MADDWTNNWWALAKAFWTVSIYDGPEVFQAGLSQHPLEVQNLLAVHWCMSEVCNGGLDQFFFNSTGVLAPEAVRGFQAIGMDELSECLAQAMGLLGTTYPRDSTERDEAMEKLYDHQNGAVELWDQLDNRFFEKVDDCAVAADAYAAKHWLIPSDTKERVALKKALERLEAEKT